MKQKGLRKLVSMILAVVMVLAMSITGFAYTISFNASEKGYTYEVYQIFTGDLSEDKQTLSNIEWGSSLTDEAKDALLTEYSVEGVIELAEKIDDAQALAKLLDDYLASMTVYGKLDDSTTSLTDVPAGYYLIVNTTVPNGDYGYSDYIVEVVDDLRIQPKNDSTPDFEKTVNESATTGDYAIGDSVPFTLTATLADSYTAYDSYKLVFTDTLSNGLTYNADSLTVTVDDEELEETDYALNVSGQTITITIEDLKEVTPTATSESVIVVSYTAKLNEDAESVENNTAYLEYSNDPNGSTTGKTGDKTYVVTFTVDVNKTNGNDEALAGAGFTLYTKDGNGDYTIKVKEIAADATTTSFSFNGLAAGSYQLVETETPDGYNTADPIEFAINAVINEDATKEDGVDVTITPITDFTIEGETLTTSIVNVAGSTLPSTGGMGATIFYIVGGVLVLGAAVLFVTKMRLGSKN